VKQNELKPAPGSTHTRKRVGRGDGSGHGNYSGRGLKGQKARAGGHVRPGFEGGQLPIIKRLPEKRGFHNRFATTYTLVSVEKLNQFEAGTKVTPAVLLDAGLIKTTKKPVKVLADGHIDRALTVQADKFSAAAKTKIEAAGGSAQELEHATEAD